MLVWPPTPDHPLDDGADRKFAHSDRFAFAMTIAPAARDGAEAYLQAHQRRCGRAITAAELRRAMADGPGDPVLMGMIRASQLRDPKSISDLAGRIRCGARQ